MSSTRRDFLQVSASTAAALALGPLARDAAAELPPAFAARGPLQPKAIRAKPVHLSKVRLTGGPLKRAQDVTAKYLLSLEPDRMLAYYRVRAGLPKKAEPYGGWDGGGRNLTGHIAGHHLSAVSLMYLATGDERFKQRADYIVSELKIVQDKNGDGYLGALEGGREAFAASLQGRHPLRRLRPQRPLVAVVHAAQDVRRPARRVSPHRATTALDVESEVSPRGRRACSRR